MAKTGSQLTNPIVRDANRIAVQACGSFVTSDATSVAQTSPLSYTGSVTTIVVPDNALECILNPTTALRVSELVGMAQYDVIAANTKESIPCADMQNIYIKQDASSGTVNFRFTVL